MRAITWAVLLLAFSLSGCGSSEPDALPTDVEVDDSSLDFEMGDAPFTPDSGEAEPPAADDGAAPADDDAENTEAASDEAAPADDANEGEQ